MKIRTILILLFLYKINIATGTIKITDAIVAIVNHHAILDSDVKKNLNFVQHNVSEINPSLSNKTPYYQETLNQLITNNLIFNIANQEKIIVKNNQINQIIDEILHLRNIPLDQFQIYLKKIGLNYKQYYSQLYQETANNIICNHIVRQRIHISQNEINAITQTLNTIDYNKQFKITHIILPLPIQATQHQIKIAENIAKSLIENDKINNNITKLINIYNSKNHIFQTIKMQKTEWISWKNMPVIFDQYLQTINTGSIIGPIQSYDGIHILKIINTRYKKFTFPITKVKIKSIVLKTLHNKHNATENLLEIKKCVDNGNTTFNIIAQENPKNYYIMRYKEYLQWNELDSFETEIKKILMNLKKNEVSMPVYTSLGWCLIQLIDIDNLNYSTMIRERAYYYLLHQKFNTIINNWIQELRSISYIKIIK